ncbi:hypothetical protein [Microbispora sp. ATCC PTA-5024]|uniref:hypothetical protein n=1 Tax=Microbispora sp. ATCC PTA-5024 TaxID=316330 RepID=UPI0003DCA7DE|nr:hypothetical protein [Microbispora sp. ATCC PTA-5024]ETK36115.1 hypothetical protein MPTA5024_10850 [Microbispora sp. ATCC PTA-5024]
MVSVTYRYVAADLLTDAYITDLPLQDVTFTRRIIEPGTLSASVEIPDAVMADRVAKVIPRHPVDPGEPDGLSTGPGRTVIHVYRNGVIWGTYLIWSASVQQQGRANPKVTIQGSTLESYLGHVIIRQDIPSFAGVDQVEIARQLITHMQSDPQADLGITLQPGMSGAVRDRTYLGTEAASYGQRLTELAQVDDGFEWLIDTSVDAGTGVRSKRWKWGYPTLGSTTGYVFKGDDVLSWQEDIDALRGGTQWQTRGESTNTDVAAGSIPLTSLITPAQDYIDAGWPRLDQTVDYSTVSEQDTLDNYAAFLAANRGGAVRVHRATVRLGPGTSFSPGNLGDYVRIMLVNAWWPVRSGVASFSKSWRVIGIDVRPVSRSDGQEQCTLTFEESVDS